jgi:hypothetical protein
MLRACIVLEFVAAGCYAMPGRANSRRGWIAMEIRWNHPFPY